MNAKKTSAFLEEIALQCKFAIIAGQDLARCYQNMEHMVFSQQNIPEPSYRLETERFWYSVQALLLATANVSKLLWPDETNHRNKDKRNREDAEMLRKSLALSDISPLRNKKMRNRFEHFDEWLERAVKPGVTYVGLHIGEMPVIENQDTKVYARNFNPDNGTITFQEEIFSIPDVMQAIIDLERNARHAIEKSITSRWQIPPKEPI
jgi:hypothetical protein